MKPPLLYLLSALVFCFILGYIDEGYYSLKTFEEPGNILVLLVYALFFWLTQLGFDWLYARIPALSGAGRKTLSVITGLFVPITVILLLAS